MHPKVARRKLKLAVFIAKALDNIFEEMMKVCTMESTFQVNTMQFDEKEKKLRVSPDFVDRSSVPLLISVLMHEARHWKMNHHGRWLKVRQNIMFTYSINSDRFPKEYLNDDQCPNMFLIFMVWNLAGDCEINQSMLHIPIVRNDAEAIQPGQYPCTNVGIGNTEMMFYRMIHNEPCRSEVLGYLL
jgi:hypothetical protein